MRDAHLPPGPDRQTGVEVAVVALVVRSPRDDVGRAAIVAADSLDRKLRVIGKLIGRLVGGLGWREAAVADERVGPPARMEVPRLPFGPRQGPLALVAPDVRA